MSRQLKQTELADGVGKNWPLILGKKLFRQARHAVIIRNGHLSDIDGVLRQDEAMALGRLLLSFRPGLLFKEGHDRQELRPSSVDGHKSRYHLTDS